MKIPTEYTQGSGYLAIFGGASYYLWKVTQGKKFNMLSFIINLILAFFVGFVMGKFLPDGLSINYRDGLISISGFLAFPILELLEDRGILLLHQFINYIFKKNNIEVFIEDGETIRYKGKKYKTNK